MIKRVSCVVVAVACGWAGFLAAEGVTREGQSDASPPGAVEHWTVTEIVAPEIGTLRREAVPVPLVSAIHMDLDEVGRLLQRATHLTDEVERQILFSRAERVMAPLTKGEHSENGEAWLYLGIARFGLAGDKDEAGFSEVIACLDEAHRLAPHNQQARYWLAKAHERMGSIHWRIDYAKAADSYSRYIEGLSGLPGFEDMSEYRMGQVKYADTLWHQGKVDEAMALYKEVEDWLEENARRGSDLDVVVCGLLGAHQIMGFNHLNYERLEESIPHGRKMEALAERLMRPGQNPDLKAVLYFGLLNYRIMEAFVSLAQEYGENALQRLDSVLSDLERPLSPDMEDNDFRVWQQAKSRSIRMAAQAMGDVDMLAPERLRDITEALRGFGLGMLATDEIELGHFAYTIIHRAYLLQQALEQESVPQSPYARLMALWSRALAEEASGRNEEAKASYGRVDAMIQEMLKADPDRPDRRDLATIGADAVAAGERVAGGEHEVGTLHRLAAQTLAWCTFNAEVREEAGFGGGTPVPGSRETAVTWGVEHQISVGYESMWHAHRVWLRHGGRVFSIGVQRQR